MSGGAAAAARGKALLDLGRAVEAERYFREALASDPDDADVLSSLARSLLHQDRFGEARDNAMRALAASPTNLNGLVVLSAALASLGDTAGALEAIRRGQQLAPFVAQLHAQEGALLLNQEQPDAALGPLNRARGLDPHDAGIVSLLAAAHFNARRFADAETAVADALRLDPDNAEAHRIQGLLALRRGGGRAAVDAHRAAVRLDPQDPDFREGLATAMKSRNPLYGLLLRYGHWLAGLPQGARIGMLFAPYLASRLLRHVDDQIWAQVLLAVVFTAVILTWVLEPLMNTVLVSSHYGRNLLPAATKRATYGFLAYTGAAIVSAAAWIATGTGDAAILAMGLALWAASCGQTHMVGPSRLRIALGLQAVGALLAVVGSVALVAGAPWAMTVIPLLIAAGILALWFTAFA